MKTALVVLGPFAVCSSASGEQQDPVVIENAHVRYTASAERNYLALRRKIRNSVGFCAADFLERYRLETAFVSR